jgi:hypothetical protein
VTRRRLEVLQWLGLLLGAGAWAGGHAAGYAITHAECGPRGAPWGIGNATWEASLMGLTAVFVVAAEVAAITVVRGTRGTTYDAEPPLARIRFFAIAAIVANALFLVIVLLAGTASLTDAVCRQA